MSENVAYETELTVYETGDTTVNSPDDSFYVQSKIELDTDPNLASYGVCH